MINQNYLQHYGILGMKWGRRRGNGNVTVVRTSTSEDHDRKVLLKSKKVQEMTNAELKAFNERMQLERQFKELTKVEISPGKKFVNELIANTAKQAVNQYVSKYSTKMVEDLLKKTS